MKKPMGRTKKGLLFFGIGVLSFSVLIAAAAIIVAILNVITEDEGFDAYTVAFIALTVFALIFTTAVVVTFYIMMQKSQSLIDSLNRVAEGDFGVEIEFRRGDAFAKVYRNFNKMTKELRSVKTLRDDFVANFSHEIKTPLFSIQGFANLLLEGGLTGEEETKFLNIISSEAGRLGRLADNALTLSKLENQQVVGERAPIKLDAELSEAVVALEREWTAKNIEVSADLAPVKIYGDAAMLGQVWYNLLSNAVKFTPAGGKVEVELSAENGFAAVRVKDSGCGVSPEDMPRIFEKYYRSPSQKDKEGNGLGLAICKRICALSGGEISAENSPGGGAVFTVRLPITEN